MVEAAPVKNLLKRHLTPRQIESLRKLFWAVGGFWYRSDLVRLAAFFQTDKWGDHRYAQHYQRYFAPLRRKNLHLLEIGVGGYANLGLGGNSLRMWKAYFRKGQIFGIDIYDKRAFEEPRIKIFQGSQEDERFLRQAVKSMGGVDIVVDDGSHMNAHVLKTFDVLFPLLNEQGIYVVEDTQTSYWPRFGGSSDRLGDADTIMGYFKKLADGLNYEEQIRPGYLPTYFDKKISAIHFYHNLIFIFKGDNSEGSNTLTNNQVRAGTALAVDQPASSSTLR
ncbi:MAG: hypothetical protein AUI47_00915 [Acidobacteria bacterium 13_1_40CM_2_68_5]|nr:MAG: hypothetical protein AUI47_00915 [Acidobacteria bacterium 13_1_40CM_2_68_5]